MVHHGTTDPIYRPHNSTDNAEALRYFAAGSFLVSIVISIVIDYGFSAKELSELGNILLYKVSWILGIGALACFAFGGWAVWTKISMINQIKEETRTPKKEEDHPS